MWRTNEIWLIISVMLASTPSVRAQPETVLLLLRPQPGDVFFYDGIISVETTIDTFGAKRSFTIQVQSRDADRVLEVNGLGVALVETVNEDMKITGGTVPDTLSGRPVLFRVRPDGTVVDRVYGTFGTPLFNMSFNDYPIPLPGRPVAVGDTWRREDTVDQSIFGADFRKLLDSLHLGITGQVTAVFTLVGLNRTGPANVASIRSRVEGKIAGTQLGESVPGVEVRMGGTMTGTAYIDWLVDEGRVLRTNGTAIVDVQSDISASGKTMQVRVTMKADFSEAPLTTSDLPKIIVSEEARIVPGQAIGSTSLSTPAEDLTARLGTAITRGPDDTYRVPSMEWPGGLVGLVDPEGRDKLIGLQVADPQFRTEKGIGARSSMGAALLAYGLAPRAIDLPGGFKLIAYDDVGIAYRIAITDQNSPESVPVGTIDRVVIFVPGSSSKIFAGL